MGLSPKPPDPAPSPAFIDFEASSLGKKGYPIEVAWAMDTGAEESHLIRPAPGWTDWSAEAEVIHGLSRDRLMTEGVPHHRVARRMMAVLGGQDLYASAPSWDGKWLSRLLRAADLPRHALRLNDTDEAHRRIVLETLRRAGVPPGEHGRVLDLALASATREKEGAGPAEHRALADARRELRFWRTVRRIAEAEAAPRLAR